MSRPTEPLTREKFGPYVNQTFRMYAAGTEPITLELIAVVSRDAPPGTPPPQAPRQRFSLTFRGPHGPTRPQRIYRLEHGELGTVDMFLVPIGPDECGMRYQAVFA